MSPIDDGQPSSISAIERRFHAAFGESPIGDALDVLSHVIPHLFEAAMCKICFPRHAFLPRPDWHTQNLDQFDSIRCPVSLLPADTSAPHPKSPIVNRPMSSDFSISCLRHYPSDHQECQRLLLDGRRRRIAESFLNNALFYLLVLRQQFRRAAPRKW
jgi:hypothetical protein